MSNTELLSSVNDPNTEPVNDCITQVIYSITEDDESDNSTIPSYLVGGLDLDIGTNYDSDSDNSTIPSYLVDELDLDLPSDSEDEDDLVPVPKLNAT